jgi:CubicO group peptidase (beta-lactamase class C family)
MTSGFTYCDGKSVTERSANEILRKLGEKGRCSARALAKELSAVPLAFEPGSHWRYGMSHDILGGLIEELSGKTLWEFLHDEIFEPLGMKDTFFLPPWEEKKEQAVQPVHRDAMGLR